MENNFDLRKFLAEGSLANSPKQINENYNDEEDREVRYNDPCERIENQLMTLYDKHGEDMISMFRRMSNAEKSGDKRAARALYFSFIKVTVFIKISNLNRRYNTQGCGDAEEFAKDYFGMDSWRDLYESTDLNEGLGSFFGSAFRWIQGKGEASMAEGDYNEGEHNEEIKEEELNESPGDIHDLLIGILGSGAVGAVTVGLGKLIDALEAGKAGEKGMKAAEMLKDLGNAASDSRNVSEEEITESEDKELNEGRGAMSFVKQAIDELMFDDPELETEKDAAEELIIAIADEYGFDLAGHEKDIFDGE